MLRFMLTIVDLKKEHELSDLLWVNLEAIYRQALEDCLKNPSQSDLSFK